MGPATRRWIVAGAMVLGTGSWVGAAERKDTASRDEAPQLLIEALRSGKADSEAVSAIVRWVLEEKEEKVARGLVDVLRSVEPLAAPRDADAERWNATAGAVLTLFQGVLRDAESHNPKNGGEMWKELAAVVNAGAPAVSDALREADGLLDARADALDRMTDALEALAPSALSVVPELIEAVGDKEPGVRLGAVAALGSMGKTAKEAVPALTTALDDPDKRVREAAGKALKRIKRE